MLDYFARASHRFATALVFLLLLAILLIVIVQITLRFLFSASLPWSEELVRCLLIWLTFMGAVVGLHEGTLVGLDLLKQTLRNPLAKRLLRLLVAFLSLCFAMATAYYGFQLVSAPGILRQSFATLAISQAWLYVPVPLSTALMVIELVAQIRREIFGTKAV